jgi:Ca2+ transporting ATPase
MDYDTKLPDAIKEGHATQKCLHFTFIFQTFVFMQVFNQINAKKIELGELNIFKGIFNNMLFVWITILTFIIQMAMVQYGGHFVKAYPLNTNQNMVCLVVGALELLVGLLIKFLPLRLF